MGAAAENGFQDDERQELLAKQAARRSSGVSPIQRLTAATQHSGTVRVMMAVAVAVSWMFVSSLLIMVNKYILKDLKFGYPMTVSGMGMFTSGVFSYVLCRVTRIFEAKAVISGSFWIKRIMPVGFFMAATLWAGNLVYLYLSVSLIQMLKAFTPVITMLALFIARLETPTGKMIGSVLGIAFGTALAAYGEMNNSVVGLLIMFASEAFESARLVMTQLLLQGLRMSPLEGLMWMAPACCAWLVLGAAAIEWPTMVKAGHHVIPSQHVLLFLLAACMGFVVNLLAYATIKLASSLTLKVLGCVKNAVVIVAAMLLFAEQVTMMQGAGYVISTIAFGLYTHIKMTEIASEPGKASGK